MSRKRSINNETLTTIKGEIENGVWDINAAANKYNVPVSTLYRSLKREFGEMPVHSCRLQDQTLKEIAMHLESNGIIPENMSSHQKMLAIDSLLERFKATDLCRAFAVSQASFTKHRQILAKGDNSHKRHENEIAEAIALIRSAEELIHPQTVSPGPYTICTVLRRNGVVTSPQLVRRILNRMCSK